MLDQVYKMACTDAPPADDDDGLRPRTPVCDWSAAEDALIEEGVARFGFRWRVIADFLLPCRSASSIRNRWNRLKGLAAPPRPRKASQSLSDPAPPKAHAAGAKRRSEQTQSDALKFVRSLPLPVAKKSPFVRAGVPIAKPVHVALPVDDPHPSAIMLDVQPARPQLYIACDLSGRDHHYYDETFAGTRKRSLDVDSFTLPSPPFSPPQQGPTPDATREPTEVAVPLPANAADNTVGSSAELSSKVLQCLPMVIIVACLVSVTIEANINTHANLMPGVITLSLIVGSNGRFGVAASWIFCVGVVLVEGICVYVDATTRTLGTEMEALCTLFRDGAVGKFYGVPMLAVAWLLGGVVFGCQRLPARARTALQATGTVLIGLRVFVIYCRCGDPVLLSTTLPGTAGSFLVGGTLAHLNYFWRQKTFGGSDGASRRAMLFRVANAASTLAVETEG